MKIKRSVAALLLLTVTAGKISAQEIKKISLDEAINMSIANSKNLKLANAKIAEAVAGVTEAKNNQLPNFNVSGSYLRLNSANIDLKTKGDSSGNSGGGPSINSALYGMATLSYPIFTGGKIKYGIESAKLLEQATRLDAANDKDAVAYNASEAYINLYKATAAVKIVEENLRSSQSRDANFSNLEKNGLLARNDMLKAQLQSSNIELSLLDAQNNLHLANVNMDLLLGLPETTVLALDSSFINTLPQVQNFLDYESMALQNRKDMQAIGIRKQAAAVGIKAAKAEAYPTIALTGGYVAAYIPNFISITNAVNIGIGIQYNLANLWKSNSALLKAKARQAQADAGESILNDVVKLQVNKDYQQYLLNTKKIEVYEKAAIQAAENFRITNNKYNNNLVTITDLLEADVALLQSRLNVSFAKADARLAYEKLLQTTGTLTK